MRERSRSISASRGLTICCTSFACNLVGLVRGQLRSRCIAMKIHWIVWVAVLFVIGCGGDDDSKPPPGGTPMDAAGGSGGGSAGGAGGAAGTGGEAGTSGTGGTGGTSGE